MRLAITITAVLALAAGAAADTIKVPADQGTIAGAEAVAVDGDTIQIAKGRYYENVTVDVPNLTITGSGVILDGNIAGSDGTCLTITSTGVTVSGISFRNGDNQIVASGGDLTITKCTFIDSNTTSIDVTAGDGLTMTGCKFYGSGGSSFHTNNVDTVVVTKCSSRSTDSDAFSVNNSNDSRFEGNTALWVEDSSGFEIVTGNNGKILKNKTMGSDDEGIYCSGTGAEIAGNTILYVNDNAGIYVTGAGAIITKNKITDVGSGVECYGNDAKVNFNKVVDVQGNVGFEVQADNITVRGNSATTGTSDCYGFYLYSNTTTGGGIIENNKSANFTDAGFYFGNFIYQVVIKNCSSKNSGADDEEAIYVGGNLNICEKLTVAGQDGVGISVSGDDNKFTACTVKSVNSDGFRVNSGDNNDFIDCSAVGCGSDGFDNRGTNTGLDGGKFRGERFDVVNDFGGGATMTLLNVNYVTGGTTTANQDD